MYKLLSNLVSLCGKIRKEKGIYRFKFRKKKKLRIERKITHSFKKLGLKEMETETRPKSGRKWRQKRDRDDYIHPC